MLEDLARDWAPSRRQHDGERSTVLHTNLARDQSASCETIENAGKRRSLMGQVRVELGDRRTLGGREPREDVRFALRKPVLSQVSEVQADAMGRAVDRRNES